ncbi:hypothetical protein Gohar_024609 [Gossypium harknessii]|uniref:Uncharacterized protein n=1 Tax=Gossypium harknessii TaxID=34285 RepID=A0A7J9HGF0_9ROSI|nr:hypothetical protein [Gossypium harknessii]
MTRVPESQSVFSWKDKLFGGKSGESAWIDLLLMWDVRIILSCSKEM